MEPLSQWNNGAKYQHSDGMNHCINRPMVRASMHRYSRSKRQAYPMASWSNYTNEQKNAETSFNWIYGAVDLWSKDSKQQVGNWNTEQLIHKPMERINGPMHRCINDFETRENKPLKLWIHGAMVAKRSTRESATPHQWINVSIAYETMNVSRCTNDATHPWIQESEPWTNESSTFPPTMAPPTWGSNLVKESAQGPDSIRFPHKFQTFGGWCPVARWPGGPVARWPGGPVARGRWPIGGEATNQWVRIRGSMNHKTISPTAQAMDQNRCSDGSANQIRRAPNQW